LRLNYTKFPKSPLGYLLRKFLNKPASRIGFSCGKRKGAPTEVLKAFKGCGRLIYLSPGRAINKKHIRLGECLGPGTGMPGAAGLGMGGVRRDYTYFSVL